MKRFTTLACSCLMAISVHAAETAPADADLPQPFDPNKVAGIIQNSPFTRSVSLSDSLILTGIAYIDAKPVATIRDTEKKTSYVVSGEPNAQGWTLTETSKTTDLNRAQAKVMIGGELVSIRYDKDALSPENMKKDKGRSPGESGDRRRDEGGGDRYQRSMPKPDPESRAKYEALSDEAKGRLRDRFMESREKLMNASPEERTAFMKKTFEKVVEEDQQKRGSGGGSSSGGSGRRN